MTLKERIKKFLPNMKKGIERFPITILFSVVIFGILVYMIHQEGDIASSLEERLNKILTLLGIGLPMTATLELIREKYFPDKNKLFSRVVEGTVTLIFLYIIKLQYLGHAFIESDFIRLFFIGVIFTILFFFIPVIGRKKDAEKYIETVVVNVFVTKVFSVVLYLGLIAIIGAVDVLLINIDNKVYLYTYMFSVFIFAMTFFLSRLKEVNENLEEYQTNIVFKTLLKFIIIPLILGYTLVLYLYLGRILIQMKMPKGVVSHLVLWYTTFSLFVMIMITPMAETDKIISEFKKNFPKISIPLILLSFVAIFQRIGQYGITESRYYIVAVAVWLLFCIIFYIFRTKVTVIMISAIAVIFVTLYVPFVNAESISLRSQNDRLEKILIKNGILKDGKLIKKTDLDEKTKAEIADIVSYINNKNEVDRKERLKVFGKESYKTADEFKNIIEMDDTWYNSYLLTEDHETRISYKLQNSEYMIRKTYGYEYLTLLSFYDGDNYESEKYKIENKKRSIKLSDKNNKELLKIDIDKILNEIMTKKEATVEDNKDYYITASLPENIMDYTGENENIKYKLLIRNFTVIKTKDEKLKFEDCDVDFYFSGK
ncbi:DUF4153 domain-containing protein [Pseudoleptotrichia goodfellowii]|uniref:DUF4153 domain-containing protein n=1 Tax=Pseudoleptotrichia goodfellowii F0264 TaxID=596323 RepID=D0GJZ2_9FUSO|nr:DUF4153 domain-containing protein [Pseudoleptotrichia goodfellowii]EEY35581.1 hypothetical protein HMPREF0554_1145 [Pseudoleptotrichia goodfellowii F0264]